MPEPARANQRTLCQRLGSCPFPDVTDGVPCCDGAAIYGPERCTCWEPIYEPAEAAAPDTTAIGDTMRRACSDCAYRPDSPERRGESYVSGDQDLLNQLVANVTPFYCHDGMQRVIGYRHVPTGEEFRPPGGIDGAYEPLQVNGVPYKADGRPGSICAGWAARVTAAAKTS